MRTRTAWLALVGALCACGKAFDAGSTAASGGTSGTSATSGAAASAGSGTGGAPSGGAGGSLAQGGRAGAGGSPSTGGSASGSGGLSSVGGGSTVAGSGGGPPLDPLIPTLGLSLWLRADVGVVQKDGLVQQWLDQSGQKMDAIQTALNVEPKFLANGLNGLPTLDFDGEDDFMKLPEGFADFTQGISLFIVMNATDGNCASSLEMSNGSEVQDISLGLYQFAWQYEVENEDIAGGVIDPPKAQPELVAVVQGTSGAVELRSNSTLLNQGQFMAPEVVLRRQNFIAHTLYQSCGYFQGQISEIAVYDRAVTDKEVLAIENYLEDHWHLTTVP